MNEAIRSLFPVTKNHIYMNHAAVSPLSTRVQEAMGWLVEDVTAHGAVHWDDWCKMYDHARTSAARLVNAQPHEIAFMRNTSDGISAVANGIDWREGNTIVTNNVEFPSNIYPWLRLERARGVKLLLSKERDGRVDPDELFSLVDHRTRVVAISWVQFSSGFRSDLERIGRFCRERNIIFFVDAIQGLGGLKMDVVRDHVDAFSADAHKYLAGPEGIALLYVSDRIVDLIAPSVVGWMSVTQPEHHLDYDLSYREGALRFECGSLNTAGVYGIGAALDLLLEIGSEKIEVYLVELGDYLAASLSEKGYTVFGSRKPGETSAIVTCTHPSHTSKVLYNLLLEKQIVTASRVKRLRISPHFYNTREEVDALVQALP